jgi:hypothetical protein
VTLNLNQALLCAFPQLRSLVPIDQAKMTLGFDTKPLASAILEAKTIHDRYGVSYSFILPFGWRVSNVSASRRFFTNARRLALSHLLGKPDSVNGQ